MVARVSADEVKEVVSTSLSDDVVLATAVDTAHLYVEEHLLTAGHSASILKKIEQFLAAHVLCLIEERGGLKGAKLGDSSEFLSDVYSDGFRSTRFGQLAIALDTSGTLVRLGAPTLKSEFRVV